jgi:hypothetical protein
VHFRPNLLVGKWQGDYQVKDNNDCEAVNKDVVVVEHNVGPDNKQTHGNHKRRPTNSHCLVGNPRMGLGLGQFGSREASHETKHGNFVGKLHLMSHGSVKSARAKANNNQTQKGTQDKWVLADFWFSIKGVNSHSGENHGR